MVFKMPTPILTRPIRIDPSFVSSGNKDEDPTEAVPAKVDKIITGIAMILFLNENFCSARI